MNLKKPGISIIAAICLGLFFIAGTSSVSAQTPKKYFSSGEKFKEVQNYTEAIASYSKAIEMDPNYEKAYPARAFCYEKIAKKGEAAEDYKRAAAFIKDKEIYFNAGRLYFDLGKYAEADQFLKQAIDKDKTYTEAVNMRIQALVKLKNFKEGLALSEMSLDNKKTAQNYYNHALMLDSLKNFAAAEKDYKDSKYFDSKFLPAYIGLANVQLQLGKLDDALNVCETALTKDPSNVEIFYTLSRIHGKKLDYVNAVNDISKVIMVEADSKTAFLQRAFYYQKMGQFQNAINDYTKANLPDDKNIEALNNRAWCYEQIANYKLAVKDYERIVALTPNKEQAQKLLKDVKVKLFELNRETVKPEITLVSPKSDEKNVVKLAGDQEELVISGNVKDGSPIKSIIVQGVVSDYNKDSLNPSFSAKVNIGKQQEFSISVTDVYDNTQKTLYTIQRTETNKPSFALLTPVTSFDNEIYLDNSSAELYIEGKVKDESLIESIVVNGVTASYQMDGFNPSFSTKISIANKDKITIKVRDVYGNETSQDYRLNRDGANIAKQNPMGTTWVVFIENASYQNFATLEGPTKDVLLMKSALANYNINKIVHKKNMSKAEMERFFSIELRDLVRANNVSSILVWYAGHGKFVNQTGYWIPVDAKVDDEFTYFNINNLKASMQSYNKVVHTLVITDACESGPSFYLAMRDTPKERRCDNWEATEFKSSQVLSSAGYELAADNSQFTKTFATALSHNPDGCIPIEKIAEKVAAALKQTSAQVPKLGKISGLEDEDGTFFFIKK